MVIQGKKAMVTGAASGIGRAVALALAAKGAVVCITDINEAGLKQTAQEIESGAEKSALPRPWTFPTTRLSAHSPWKSTRAAVQWTSL